MLKYEVPDEHDPATKALTKVGEVKNIMHDNIAMSLQNTTSMEMMSHTTGGHAQNCRKSYLIEFFVCRFRETGVTSKCF